MKNIVVLYCKECGQGYVYVPNNPKRKCIRCGKVGYDAVKDKPVFTKLMVFYHIFRFIAKVLYRISVFFRNWSGKFYDFATKVYLSNEFTPNDKVTN